MKKLKNNQLGFGAIELILVLIIMILLGVVGWFVYDRNHNKAPANNSTSTSTSTTTETTTSNKIVDPYAGWKTYSDDFIDFKYPDNWQVVKQYTFTDSYGAYLINFSGPVDTTVSSTDNPGAQIKLMGSILIAKNGRFGANTCNSADNGCKIEVVDNSSIKSPATQGEIIISDDGAGLQHHIEFSSSKSSVGGSTYTLGAAINNNYYGRIFGSFGVGDVSSIKISSGSDAIQKSKSYGQLKLLIQSAAFKTTNLP